MNKPVVHGLLLSILASINIAHAEDAILNVEGEIQINGKTVIDSKGQLVNQIGGDNLSSVVINCTTDSGALKNSIEQGYTRIAISGGECTLPWLISGTKPIYIEGKYPNIAELSISSNDYNDDGTLIRDGSTVTISDARIVSNGDFDDLFRVEKNANLRFNNIEILGGMSEYCVSLDSSAMQIEGGEISGCTAAFLVQNSSALKTWGETHIKTARAADIAFSSTVILEDGMKFSGAYNTDSDSLEEAFYVSTNSTLELRNSTIDTIGPVLSAEHNSVTNFYTTVISTMGGSNFNPISIDRGAFVSFMKNSELSYSGEYPCIYSNGGYIFIDESSFECSLHSIMASTSKIEVYEDSHIKGDISLNDGSLSIINEGTIDSDIILSHHSTLSIEESTLNGNHIISDKGSSVDVNNSTLPSTNFDCRLNGEIYQDNESMCTQP